MNKGINVLSLFDGKSSGYTALELAEIPVNNYYSAEVDKYAIQVSNAIHPSQNRLGDVTKWRGWNIDWSSIDLVLGGFPCQAWSMAGKQLGDKDERGMLFWVMLDIMKEVRKHNPKADFLIENVKMKKGFEEYITYHTEQALGEVHKTLINSALVSAQNRNRYYWTSFKVEQPEDEGVMLKDIIEYDCNDVNSDGWHEWFGKNKEFQLRKGYSKIIEENPNDKAICMTARQYASWNGNFVKCGSMIGRKINPETGKRDDYNPDIKTEQRIEVRSDDKTGTLTTVQKDNLLINVDRYRKLTPRECFRLQTVPEHYIDKILHYGEVYTHSQTFYNSTLSNLPKSKKCKPVKSMAVSNQSQVEKLNCAISTILGSLDTVLLKQPGNLSIKASYAQSQGASVIAKLQEVCASSITNHGKGSMTNQLENVRFALKTSEVDGVECVLGTLNQNQNMEIQTKLILTPEENSNLMGIKVSNISKIQTVDGLIELLQKKLLVESSSEGRWYIILMAINLIIARSIFLFANLTHNTYLCIDSLSQSQCNSLEMVISTLKMENIKPTSNSNLYKIAGNGWTDEVIAHIFREMKNANR